MSDSRLVLAGRYRLVSRIAGGAVGEVWRGEDLVLGRPIAVKRLRAEYAEHPETRARFRSEARHAASVLHPGIAQVYDYDESSDPGQPFLVMELIDGPSLAGVLNRGPLPPGQVMDIVAQVAAGLSAAHGAGLVHRDIKPANVLLTRSGQVKITDFGIAYAAGSAPVTRQGVLIGTPAYLAPERVAGHPATPASDLYSLGILAYECLAGWRPYAGTPVETALAHGQQELPPLPQSVPGPVTGFVTELAAKDPGARPASAAVAAAHAAALRDSLAAGRLAARDRPPDQAGSQTLIDAHPMTLVDSQIPGYQDPRGQAPGHRSWPGRRVALAVVACLAAIGIAGWLVSALASGPASAGPGAKSPGTAARTHQTARSTVMVHPANLVGEPVRVVVRTLTGLGLQPHVRWVHPGFGSDSPGMVTYVTPGGRVQVGSVVLVDAVRRYGHGYYGHDHGHGHGHGHGNQGGNQGGGD